jgi:hypothetical protein
MIQLRSSKRRSLAALAAVAVTVGAVACNESLSLDANSTWGFIFLQAEDGGGGQYRVAPNGVFFVGQITGIPNSAVQPDSCFEPRAFTGDESVFEGVRFLDAGASITAKLGSVSHEIPRLVVAGNTSYELSGGATLAYTPGDTVRVTIPGATGGFPPATVNGRSAEAFTMQPLTVPTDNKPIQLRWTAAIDTGSALILSLRYRPTGSTTTLEIPCAFQDDGIDSILFADYSAWTAASNTQVSNVATRLRTSLVQVPNGFLELISTFRAPTTQGLLRSRP